MDEETTKVAKLNRQNFLLEILQKYTQTEPRLTDEQVSEVISWWCGDLTEFLKVYRKQVKRDTKNL